MGGTNAVTISGLRFHISGVDVHIHDDTKKLKYTNTRSAFQVDLEGAMEDLKSVDGMVRIKGTSSNDLCVVKDGKNMYCFLTDSTSVKTKLKDFLRNLYK